MQDILVTAPDGLVRDGMRLPDEQARVPFTSSDGEIYEMRADDHMVASLPRLNTEADLILALRLCDLVKTFAVPEPLTWSPYVSHFRSL